MSTSANQFVQSLEQQGNQIRGDMQNQNSSQPPPPVQSQPPPPVQSQPQNIQASKFSTYAADKQLKLKTKQQTIQQTIKDAVHSHVLSLQYYMNIDNSITKQHEKCRNQIIKILGDINGVQLKQIFQNPNKFIKKPTQQLIKQGFQKTIKKFLLLLKFFSRYYLIDGRIIKTDKILASQYLQKDSQIMIPTLLHPQLYIKTQDKQIIQYVYLKQGNFINKQLLHGLSLKEKQVILKTVTEFLQSQGILDKSTQDQKLFFQKFNKLISKSSP